jgi:hypothetical protein
MAYERLPIRAWPMSGGRLFAHERHAASSRMANEAGGLFLHGKERRVLTGCFDGFAKRPAGPRGKARDGRVWLAPQRRSRRGARRVFLHGKERHVLTGCFDGFAKRPASPRGERATYASGSRRNAAMAVAHVASREIARFVCSRLPSDLPGAFASA